MSGLITTLGYLVVVAAVLAAALTAFAFLCWLYALANGGGHYDEQGDHHPEA